jgi:hypothetical protein
VEGVTADAPLLTTILELHRAALGADFAAYRNHCLRVIAMTPAPSTDDAAKVQIAAAFHDLGIWTHRIFDYLEPSAALARDWLAAHDLLAWSDEIAAMILWHHRLRPAPGPASALVENFRRADWCDVLLGWPRFGIPRDRIRAARAEHPDAGFHWKLVQLTAAQMVREPWRPLPMLRW